MIFMKPDTEGLATNFIIFIKAVFACSLRRSSFGMVTDRWPNGKPLEKQENKRREAAMSTHWTNLLVWQVLHNM